MKRTSRKPSNLSESLQRRLNAYALAASAAGLGMLAFSQSANAKVVYTRAHTILKLGNHYNLDLNHDQTNDFYFRNFSTDVHHLNGLEVAAYRSAPNGVAASSTSSGYGRFLWPLALEKGVKVGPANCENCSNDRGYYMDMVDSLKSGKVYGHWSNVRNRYLGLAFTIKGRVHYGWARWTVQNHNDSIVATLTGYAYETVPGKAIITGRTKGPAVITLEPASLGHLAAGAPAILVLFSGK